MAEALVSVILEQLTTILFEEARQEVKLVVGVGKEIDKLKSNFESIHALLDDAEQRQIGEKSIKLWLDKLKEVSYDMEDLLDEWMTALLKIQIDEADQSESSRSMGKVRRCLIPCCCSVGKVVHRRDIAKKIMEINERLDDIAKEKDRYQLAASRDSVRNRRVESTSFAKVSQLYGRDEDKQQLVSCLLCGSSDQVESDVKTISIIGMGGIGKTTLAQLVYNDGDVKTYFDKRVWVCVSEAFDVSRVAKAILEGLGHPSENCLTLQGLLERTSESIEGKKVFLVLDDVWTDESKNWESLKQALTAAAPGSRVLVTTRKDTVVKAMDSFHVFPLEELNDKDCWKILRQEAFVGRTDREQFKNLEDTGRKIAEKCRGLPLAAKTLGSMLRSKNRKEEWERILNSEMWRLDLVQNEVFKPLLLSYYDLPSAVRRCFLYCSVFPKDYEIRRDDVIREWMAQGYLSCEGIPEMEETGFEYFDCLVARSFFQESEVSIEEILFEEIGDDRGPGRPFKMHDIVVDFARFLMGNEVVCKELHNSESSSSVENSSRENTRHLLVTRKAVTPSVLHSMVSGVEKLRSLAISGDSDDDSDSDGESARALRNLCKQPKSLRSLSLVDGRSVPEFPKEVGKLMHLRLLNLSRSHGLERLPDAICNLYNLQSLYLRECDELKELPDKIEKLINLRTLDTYGSYSITCYPKGIGRLTSLRCLRGISVSCDGDDRNKFSLGDLGNLCCLRSLSMILLGGTIDGNEARRANLQSKVHLGELDLDVSYIKDRDNVINVLNPPSQCEVSTNLRCAERDKRVGMIKIRRHAQEIRAAILFQPRDASA